MSDALIRLEGVTVGFTGQTVLDKVELTIQPGEIVTLIGPNGAGKTTLVRAVLGLLTPDSGTVWRKPKLQVQLRRACVRRARTGRTSRAPPSLGRRWRRWERQGRRGCRRRWRSAPPSWPARVRSWRQGP